MHRPLSMTAALVALMGWASPARAIPTIAVDLDLSAPGLQSRLTVSPGEAFSVAIVYVSDGLAVFDTVGLGVAFNDAGAVLGLGPGVTPGDPRFGPLAGEATDLVQEFGTFDQAFVGSPMRPEGTFTPPVGFDEGVGPFGYAVRHPGVFTPGADATITAIMTLNFVALMTGNSAVCPEPFSPFLFLDGVGVDARQAGAVVTVVDTSVPEPATLLLSVAGLVGLGLVRRHVRA